MGDDVLAATSTLLGDLRLAVALARALPGCEVRVGAPARLVRYAEPPPGPHRLGPTRPLGRLAAAVAASGRAGDLEAFNAEVAVGGAGMQVDLVPPENGARHLGGGVYEAHRGDQMVDLFATLLDPSATRQALRGATGHPHLVGPDAWAGLRAPRPRVHLIGAHDVAVTIVAVRFGASLLPPTMDAIRGAVVSGRAACLVAELGAELEPSRVRFAG